MKPSSQYRLVLIGAALAAPPILALRTRSSAPRSLSRRALIKVGSLGATALALGVWRRPSALASSAPSAVLQVGRAKLSASGASAVLKCVVLAPEETEGPFYIPREKVRSNIVENRDGAHLALTFTVIDASTCKPIKGAAVDIWHCDAEGAYSGFGNGGTKTNFLRGIQRTDASGRCRFHTVYPGWYQGRTVHIHVKVHVVGNVAHTGQLYFNDSFTARVYKSKPYKARASARDTFNGTDSIFLNGGGPQSMLTVKAKSGGGYSAAISLGVRRK